MNEIATQQIRITSTKVNTAITGGRDLASSFLSTGFVGKLVFVKICDHHISACTTKHCEARRNLCVSYSCYIFVGCTRWILIQLPFALVLAILGRQVGRKISNIC